MELKQYCFVLSQLVGRDVKKKYIRSKLGIIWSVLNPLLLMVVISMVFSTIFVKTIKNYPLYYISGIIIWNVFTEATKSSMDSLVDNKSMLLKTKLPKQIFPLSRVFTAFVNMTYTLIAYIIVMVFFKSHLSLTAICFPSILLLLFIFSTGLGYILSIINVYFGDVKYLYTVFLKLLVYISAIFYPIESLNGFTYKIVSSNPIYWFISSTRNTLIYGKWIDMGLWIKMCVISIATFVIGIIFFKINENKIMQKL